MTCNRYRLILFLNLGTTAVSHTLKPLFAQQPSYIRILFNTSWPGSYLFCLLGILYELKQVLYMHQFRISF